MKLAEHIWHYISSSMYRTYCHLYSKQSMLDDLEKQRREMLENQARILFKEELLNKE